MTQETKKILTKLVANGRQTIAQLTGEANPQIVAVLAKTKAEVELAEAVLMALHGDMALLKILAE